VTLKIICHYVILNVIFYAFNEMNSGKLTFIFLIFFVKRMQNDVKDDVMRDAK